MVGPLASSMLWRAALLGVAFAAGWVSQGWRAEAQLQRIAAQQAQLRAQAGMATAAAEQAARAEESQRHAALQETTHAAEEAMRAARADAADARRAADRLRQRLAAAIAADPGRGAASAGAAAGGAPATDAAGMCAELLGRAVDRARILAEHADRAAAAGTACERSYDALSEPSR